MIHNSQSKLALLSVFDKTGIVEFAKELVSFDYKIISTGGTAKTLQENNISVIPIQEITGNPECFDGRIKTISFQIESGILYDRTNPDHIKQAIDFNIRPIDIVVCNLYPFEKTVSDENVKLEDAVENIDVGGPTMIRAAAKNYKNVLVVVDPNDYSSVTEYLKSHPEFISGSQMLKPVQHDGEFSQSLMSKAFAHLSFYDSQIARFFSKEQFPSELTLAGRKTIDLRYGENPHQKAAVYMFPNTNSPLKNLQKHWGRELSHVNVTDIYAGLESVRLFKEHAAAVIKHNSPCGIALGKDSQQALERAIQADPESAFGGIIVLNSIMDKKTADIIASFKDEKRGNIDIIAVPQVDADALEFLKSVRKTMGIYTFGQVPQKKSHAEHIKFIDGGFIYQTGDNDIEGGFTDWEVVTKNKPTPEQLKQMQIGWKFISRIKSNAIVIMDRDLPMTRGIGCGQTSRVRSTKIALEQADTHNKGGILISDSFFPFDDSVKLAASKGIAAVLQQGGSINDKASIEAANSAGIPMVFTHRRAFWH
jgi:phosphoribosylaminoimidazolecarboxamide formyltransferase / IMP cyclohydrolase